MSIVDPSIATSKQYDVIIIGSGAAGGTSAYVLTKAGVNVLMIEAGPDNSPRGAEKKEFYNPQSPTEILGESESGWALPNEPYMVENLTRDEFAIAKDIFHDAVDEDQNFTWFRARMTGGRTNYWGQTSLRFGPYDFKPYDFDGQAVNWPITYEELAPYYGHIEQVVGVTGSTEGLENNPDSPYFLPPPKFLAIDHIFRRAGANLGMPVISKRSAILTRQLPHRPDRKDFSSATDYHHACLIGAAFQSMNGLILPAMTTGKLDLICNCMATQISLDAKGAANGVHFVDKHSGKTYHAASKAVVLAAGSLESVRLLLNSKSSAFPNGIGNSHGQLGKWIMDTTQFDHGKVRIPSLQGLKPFNEDGVSVSHAYAPWTKWAELKSGKLGFTRGFYLSWKGGRRLPSFKSISRLFSLEQGNKVFYGEEWKRLVRHNYGSLFTFYTPGEMIPNEKSLCEIDPDLKDRWGTPSLRMNFQWGDQEVVQTAHKIKVVSDLVHEAGGEFVDGIRTDAKPNPGGSNHHESGGARMSADRKSGVTNSESQVWDCPNIAIADSAVFASTSCKNPTLTIMALAWRTSVHLIAKMKNSGV